MALCVRLTPYIFYLFFEIFKITYLEDEQRIVDISRTLKDLVYGMHILDLWNHLQSLLYSLKKGYEMQQNA